MELYKSDVYKSRDGRHLLHSLYRKHLMRLDIPVKECMIETRFGNTHLVLYGNPKGKPVLTFYGENAINPLSIYPFTKNLDMDKLLLIVPDPPGQTGFSEERKLSFSKKEYGEWACQIMDGLKMQTATILGYSFGGSIALQLCSTSVLRVERLLLVMPSGIANTPSSRIARLVKPAALKDENAITNEIVKNALHKILPFQNDDLLEAAKTLFLHSKMEKTACWNIKKREIQKFKSPVYLITEKSDYLFPGEAVQKQALKIIPRLDGRRTLTLGSSHCGLFKNEENEDLKEAYTAMSYFLLQTT